MASIPFADNYLAGSLLTLLLPVCLLIAIAVWYVIAVKKVPDTPSSSPSLPSSEVVAAASAQGAEPGSSAGAQSASPTATESNTEPSPAATPTATEPGPENSATEPPATGD
jgi:cytoskeletal protein RodZ